MWRWLTIVLAIVSLAGCVATARLTLHSYRVKDKWEYVSAGGWSSLAISRAGRLDVLYSDAAPHDDAGWTHVRGAPTSLGGTDYGRRFLGFGAGVAPSGARYVNVPYWFTLLLTALPPLAVARRELRRRRTFARGLCLACGYDLRATTHRCPECGTAVASPAPP